MRLTTTGIKILQVFKNGQYVSVFIGPVAALNRGPPKLRPEGARTDNGEAKQEEPVKGSAIHGGDQSMDGPLIAVVPDQLP
jgi:hypothetical protein